VCLNVCVCVCVCMSVCVYVCMCGVGHIGHIYILYYICMNERVCLRECSHNHVQIVFSRCANIRSCIGKPETNARLVEWRYSSIFLLCIFHVYAS